MNIIKMIGVGAIVLLISSIVSCSHSGTCAAYSSNYEKETPKDIYENAQQVEADVQELKS